IGSAVNDATRELGGTLGVAVIGSVALSLYRGAFDGLRLPAAATDAARESLGGAFQAAGALPPPLADSLRQRAEDGFLDGMAAGCLVAGGVALAGAVMVAWFLPSQPAAAPQEEGQTGLAPEPAAVSSSAR
ncbi:MAG TPA: hypothetical protein VFY44_03650, partial [Thermoleophilaceae bacterium]|nr:hypothetical protein [Thermoleophilaceae bacterium]